MSKEEQGSKGRKLSPGRVGHPWRRPVRRLVFSWEGAPCNRRKVIDFFELKLVALTEQELAFVLCKDSYLIEFRYAAARMIGLDPDQEKWAGPRLQFATYSYGSHKINLGKVPV